MSNLGDLEIFARVVTAGSMSAAGRELGLSPAVVSKRMRRLEDRLGTRLLHRTTRQISLTEAGQGFYERVVAILAGIEEAESFVSRGSALARGVLKVSAPTSFGRLHIAPHINVFMQANPDLGVNLVLRDEFVDIVGDGYDLAIRIAELDDSSLVARKLAPVRRILVAAPEYLERHGTPASLDDLEHHICLAPHNNDPWKLEGPNGQMVYRPVGPLQTNSSEVVREAVIGGVGIALRSTWDIGGELSDGRLVQVLPAYEGSRNVAIHAVYASRRFLPAKVRLFIDYLAELYGPAPYWDNLETSAAAQTDGPDLSAKTGSLSEPDILQARK
ncbi:LysR family transcriptional regulator [Hoeflea sp. YIM 152468]|uniref:LysR family transcriptional regulator n=1 Tax=Hoeflea sp. YIM 152468 TaxID=3031759 RepID=UPI0023DCAEDD|nr:LysR family transcriptional regulator [Hoeflea sp. YIM 152468]MDF1606802.1 LysR family transcriptional regulator [Hoeflea sp. YIM 152468]